jgi:hypothetical protein
MHRGEGDIEEEGGPSGLLGPVVAGGIAAWTVSGTVGPW